MRVYILIAFVFSGVLGKVTSPLVDLPTGKLEGTIKQTVNGRSFYSFEGVPYARPPVGKYRFREPEPPKPWTGIWKANTIHKCLQYSHFALKEDPIMGQEDCLYLNIYTPDLNPKQPLDVLVYIHGGAFMFNYGGWQGPGLLLDRNIVYINFNYRLGPLGFLSTEDEVVPGNNGIRDQILALKWVKQNVKYFGGNPDSITIMGMSAGAASVHLHYLSPESKGLFHRGFSQSGSAMCPWVLMERGAEKARKLGELVGCNTEDTKTMVDCMKRRPGLQIVEAVRDFMPWLYNPFSPFGVVVDSWASNPVLPEHPYNLLKKKKVTDLPYITTATGAEGLYPGAEFYSDEHLKELDSRWNELIPLILDYNHTVDPALLDSVSSKIRKFYLKDKPVNKETFKQLIDALSDRIFLNDIEKTIKMQGVATKSPIYVYIFNYRGAHSKSEILSGTDENLGASHADDTSYITKTVMDTLSTEDDRKMVDIFLNMITSFAKTGKPEMPVEWKPSQKSLSGPITYLRIDSPVDLTLETKNSLGHSEFWNTLPIKENDKLFVSKDEL